MRLSKRRWRRCRGSRSTSRMRWRVKGRLWVSREGGGERDSGDTVYSVKGKVGLFPYSPAAEELSH